MNEDDLAAKYTRVVKTKLGQWVQALVIQEPQAENPVPTWKGVGRMLPVRALPENVELARRAALKDSRFFQVCTQCGELKPSSLVLKTGCVDCVSAPKAMAAA